MPVLAIIRPRHNAEPRPKGEDVVDLVDALKKGVASETATSVKGKKPRKATSCHKELLFPIEGKSQEGGLARVGHSSGLPVPIRSRSAPQLRAIPSRKELLAIPSADVAAVYVDADGNIRTAELVQIETPRRPGSILCKPGEMFAWRTSHGGGRRCSRSRHDQGLSR